MIFFKSLPLLLAFVLLLAPRLPAQVYDRTWSVELPEATVHRIAIDRDSNVIVAGWFSGTLDLRAVIDGGSDPRTSREGQDAFVAKIGADGSYRWIRQIGDTLRDRVDAVVTDERGNIYLAGQVERRADYRADFGGGSDRQPGGGFVMRIDADGSYGWTRVIVDTVRATQYIRDLAVVGGEIHAIGRFSSEADLRQTFGPGHERLVAYGARDMILMKLDTAGALTWAKAIGGGGSEEGNSVAIGTGGEIYVGMTSTSNGLDIGAAYGGESDTLNSAMYGTGIVTKLDREGGHFWSRQLGGPSEHTAIERVRLDAAGNLYVLGMFAQSTNFRRDFDTIPDIHVAAVPYSIFVTRINADGTYGWTRSFGGPHVNIPIDLAIDPAGDLILGGVLTFDVAFSPGFGAPGETVLALAEDGFLMKVSADGELRWVKLFGEAFEDAVEAVAVGPGGSIWFGGFFAEMTDFRKPFDGSSDIHGNSDATRVDNHLFLTHIVDDGIAAVRDVEAMEWDGIAVRPNPITDEAVIHLDENAGGPWVISLYDGLGRLIGRSATSDPTTRLDMRNLPAGIYGVRCVGRDRTMSTVVVKR